MSKDDNDFQEIVHLLMEGQLDRKTKLGPRKLELPPIKSGTIAAVTVQTVDGSVLYNNDPTSSVIRMHTDSRVDIILATLLSEILCSYDAILTTSTGLKYFNSEIFMPVDVTSSTLIVEDYLHSVQRGDIEQLLVRFARVLILSNSAGHSAYGISEKYPGRIFVTSSTDEYDSLRFKSFLSKYSIRSVALYCCDNKYLGSLINRDIVNGVMCIVTPYILGSPLAEKFIQCLNSLSDYSKPSLIKARCVGCSLIEEGIVLLEYAIDRQIQDYSIINF